MVDKLDDKYALDCAAQSWERLAERRERDIDAEDWVVTDLSFDLFPSLQQQGSLAARHCAARTPFGAARRFKNICSNRRRYTMV
jgi:hypothetical protein